MRKLPVPLLSFFLMLVNTCLSAQAGVFYKTNPLPTHYFLAPTGFSLKDGERIYHNQFIAIHHVSTGKANNKVLGWGFVPTFVLTGDLDYIPVWVSGRKSFSFGEGRPKITIGGVGIDLPKKNEGDAFALYSSVTFGNKDKNLTAGVLGINDATKNARFPFLWAITLHGMVRAGLRTWLITENYVLQTPEPYSFLSIHGVRILKPKFAFEAGLAFGRLSLFDGETSRAPYLALPVLGLKIPFKGKTSRMAELLKGQ